VEANIAQTVKNNSRQKFFLTLFWRTVKTCSENSKSMFLSWIFGLQTRHKRKIPGVVPGIGKMAG
jgi:hypothetical protein